MSERGSDDVAQRFKLLRNNTPLSLDHPPLLLLTSTSLLLLTFCITTEFNLHPFKGSGGFVKSCLLTIYSVKWFNSGSRGSPTVTVQPACTNQPSSAQLAEQISLRAGSVRQQNGWENFGGRLPGLQS